MKNVEVWGLSMGLATYVLGNMRLSIYAVYAACYTRPSGHFARQRLGLPCRHPCTNHSTMDDVGRKARYLGLTYPLDR